MESYSCIAQEYFKGIYGMSPLSYDDIYVEYSCDLCFYSNIHDES